MRSWRGTIGSSCGPLSQACRASKGQIGAVPAWAVGTFYGKGCDSFAEITVFADGEVSGILLSEDGAWTIDGVASGLCIVAEVVDAAGNAEPVVLRIFKAEDSRCRTESEDGSICVLN